MDTNSSLIEYVNLYFTTGVRWVFLGLAALILLHQIFALLKMHNPSEIWAYLKCPDGSNVPLTHWENLMGRHRGCDIILNLSSVSRSHGTLIRDSEGIWTYNDLNSKNGSLINGVPVTEPTRIQGGDVLTIGGSDFELYPLSLKERMDNIEKRKRNTKRTSPWFSMFAISIFQFLTVIQFHISLGEDFNPQIPTAFGLICALMWVYVILLRILKRTAFEIELIAFFLSTLSLAITISAFPGSAMKQSICVLLGVILFFAMCWFLRDLNRAKRFVKIFIALSVILLIFNLLIGTAKYGSQNWIVIGGFSLQPSELVKIVFIFVGAATLDELQKRKNLFIFMGFSVFCLCCLAIMGDFGTALIFFVTFLVISFLRSGDFTKILLILGASGLMGLMVLRFKPYIADRIEIWGHSWDYPLGGGYQMVQTMTSAASGGLPGLGAGAGNLSDVGAASADLVFGVLAEEWGLVIAILAVLCIVTLGFFAWRSIIAGRSTYYCIAACATTTLFMFQTMLNVFGSIDLLPLTGVTFPFVSSGGTSMIASWGMLAFLKAADTRQNASLAVRIKDKYVDNISSESMSAYDYYEAQDYLDELDQNLPDSEPVISSFDEEFPVYESNIKGTQNIPYEDVDQYIRPIPSFSSSFDEDVRPKPEPVQYTDFSDDDFFDQFDDVGNLGSFQRSGQNYTDPADDVFRMSDTRHQPSVAKRPVSRDTYNAGVKKRSTVQYKDLDEFFNDSFFADLKDSVEESDEQSSPLTLDDLFGDKDSFRNR